MRSLEPHHDTVQFLCLICHSGLRLEIRLSWAENGSVGASDEGGSWCWPVVVAWMHGRGGGVEGGLRTDFAGKAE